MKKFIVFILVCAATILFPTIAKASTLRVGSTGQEVVALQTKLNNVGYSVGRVDGIFGSKTRQGVVSYQGSHGLAADGIVGTLTNHSVTADSVIVTAESYMGVPYVWGGSSPSGFDCSGLTSYVFAKNGITLPRVSKDQATVGTSIAYGNLQKGDLVFFATTGAGVVSHVGIYVGNGQFINASTSKGVTIYLLSSSYWQSTYMGARRVIP